MVFLVPVLSYAAVILCAAMAFARAPAPRPPRHLATVLLRYVNLFPVGLMGLWGAVGHLIFPARAAAAIGWAPSPFQTEVGMANLGLGVAGVIAAIWPDWGFRAGVAVVTAGFLGGAAANHMVLIVQTGNMAAGNAGPILYTDLITPLLLLVLLALTYRSGGRAGA